MNQTSDPHYWMGHLAMTVAIATTTKTDPKPVLKTALRDFLRTRPPGNELGDLIRTTIKEGKT